MVAGQGTAGCLGGDSARRQKSALACKLWEPPTLASCRLRGEGRGTWPTNLDGFFSHRCCQASSPMGLYFVLVFIFYTEEISQFLHSCGTKNHEAFFTIYVVIM